MISGIFRRNLENNFSLNLNEKRKGIEIFSLIVLQFYKCKGKRIVIKFKQRKKQLSLIMNNDVNSDRVLFSEKMKKYRNTLNEFRLF